MLDNEEEVRKKVNSAEFVVGNADNGVMAFLKYVIMVIKEDKKEPFIVERPVKYGGNINFIDYKSVKDAFIKRELHPMDLKNAVAKEIIELLNKVDKKKLNELAKKAY